MERATFITATSKESHGEKRQLLPRRLWHKLMPPMRRKLRSRKRALNCARAPTKYVADEGPRDRIASRAKPLLVVIEHHAALRTGLNCGMPQSQPPSRYAVISVDSSASCPPSSSGSSWYDARRLSYGPTPSFLTASNPHNSAAAFLI